ncbi:MAG: substrate-binding domain-containing protein, partial [Kiritimatiellae bacterium]|nr:substrate-binding domain-containing protein [Kiritimatiellia bacterium]
ERSTAADVRALAAQARPIGFLVDEGLREAHLAARDFCGVPAVRIDPSRTPRTDGVSAVICDNAAVARAAFEELSAGLPSCYAAVTYRLPRIWARERVAAFRTICRAAGARCIVFPERPGEESNERAARLARWTAALPQHCAVFAVNDYTAWETWRALRSQARHVPKSATVIGADGFDLAPDGDISRLSSVRLDFERMGFLAAKSLAELATHRKPGRRPAVVALGPLLVIRRESTRGRGRRDERILDAVAMIRAEACQGLTAAALAARFRCSRNLFERRFREAMGHSVLDEIIHIRLEQVCEMLRLSRATIAQIAERCGFGTERDLRKIFTSRLKTSPRLWRRENSL